MITYSHDGKFILTANEGEPNDDYSQDPDGSVSIIDVAANYAVTTLNFAGFSSQLATLKTKGMEAVLNQDQIPAKSTRFYGFLLQRFK